MRLKTAQRAFARKLRREQTDAERRIWYLLRGRRFRGLRFRRQHPIGPYFADFACIELGLVVELDGSQHAAANARHYDQRRTEVLAEHGFEVIRFWDNDVLQNTQGVLQAIDSAVRERRTLTRPLATLSRDAGEGEGAEPSPQPSPAPAGEGGRRPGEG